MHRKKIPTNAGKAYMSPQHEQNFFVLTETTQTQMPQEKCQKCSFYENLQNDGPVNTGKNI